MLKEKDVHWFAIRVSHSSLNRLMSLKDHLDKEENVLATYVPFAFMQITSEKMGFAPSLVNYIYVRISLDNLRTIKGNRHLYEPLRFIMHPAYDEKFNRHMEPVYLSDKKMDDFILTTSEANDKVIFLDNPDYACKPSQGVQITQGQFAGVRGRIKRIMGNRCVVLPIGRDVAVAITGIPKKHLRYLTPEEMEDDFESTTYEDESIQ